MGYVFVVCVLTCMVKLIFLLVLLVGLPWDRILQCVCSLAWFIQFLLFVFFADFHAVYVCSVFCPLAGFLLFSVEFLRVLQWERLFAVCLLACRVYVVF
jgi:hypothetical protein